MEFDNDLNNLNNEYYENNKKITDFNNKIVLLNENSLNRKLYKTLLFSIVPFISITIFIIIVFNFNDVIFKILRVFSIIISIFIGYLFTKKYDKDNNLSNKFNIFDSMKSESKVLEEITMYHVQIEKLIQCNRIILDEINEIKKNNYIAEEELINNIEELKKEKEEIKVMQKDLSEDLVELEIIIKNDYANKKLNDLKNNSVKNVLKTSVLFGLGAITIFSLPLLFGIGSSSMIPIFATGSFIGVTYQIKKDNEKKKIYNNFKNKNVNLKKSNIVNNIKNNRFKIRTKKNKLLTSINLFNSNKKNMKYKNKMKESIKKTNSFVNNPIKKNNVNIKKLKYSYKKI